MDIVSIALFKYNINPDILPSARHNSAICPYVRAFIKSANFQSSKSLFIFSMISFTLIMVSSICSRAIFAFVAVSVAAVKNFNPNNK